MRYASLLLVLGLAACADPVSPSPLASDEAAVRAVMLSTPTLSWQDLRIHPVLAQRACSVSTLVNEDGQTVGYCKGGRQCRTNDWRPVADGCGPGEVPGMTPTPGGVTVAGRR